MKYRTYYNRIDRVVYEFDEHDIRLALMKYAGIKEYQPDKRIEFELPMDYETQKMAVITVIYETEREVEEEA